MVRRPLTRSLILHHDALEHRPRPSRTPGIWPSTARKVACRAALSRGGHGSHRQTPNALTATSQRSQTACRRSRRQRSTRGSQRSGRAHRELLTKEQAEKISPARRSINPERKTRPRRGGSNPDYARPCVHSDYLNATSRAAGPLVCSVRQSGFGFRRIILRRGSAHPLRTVGKQQRRGPRFGESGDALIPNSRTVLERPEIEEMSNAVRPRPRSRGCAARCRPISRTFLGCPADCPYSGADELGRHMFSTLVAALDMRPAPRPPSSIQTTPSSARLSPSRCGRAECELMRRTCALCN